MEMEKKMAESSWFKQVGLPQQKVYGEVVFPTVVTQDFQNPTSSSSISRLTEAIRDNKAWLESLLHKNGAILFRGFPISSASDFDAVVEAFGYDQLPYIGGSVIRTNVVGRVSTANESPPDQEIPFHHEMSMQPEFPSKLFFYCLEQPVSGGETPIALSHIVYERIKAKHPDLVHQLEQHGLIYSRLIQEEDSVSNPLGLGWKSKFSANNKIAAEESAAKLGLRLEWVGNAVKTRLGPLPAIKLDEEKKRKIWFNNMFTNKDTTFGNGKPLPDNIVHDCLQLVDEECSVAIPWQKGDVMFLDNLAVLHARRPLIQPPRTILASLCK